MRRARWAARPSPMIPGCASTPWAARRGWSPPTSHRLPGCRLRTAKPRRRLQDAANNASLLEQLEHLGDRRARFVSTLVAVRSADDPEPLVAVGRWFGEVLRTPRGEGGFGYDPLMFVPALGRSVAELTSEVKNAHSHRALAVEQMLRSLREAWHLG